MTESPLSEVVTEILKRINKETSNVTTSIIPYRNVVSKEKFQKKKIISLKQMPTSTSLKVEPEFGVFDSVLKDIFSCKKQTNFERSFRIIENLFNDGEYYPRYLEIFNSNIKAYSESVFLPLDQFSISEDDTILSYFISTQKEISQIRTLLSQFLVKFERNVLCPQTIHSFFNSKLSTSFLSNSHNILLLSQTFCSYLNHCRTLSNNSTTLDTSTFENLSIISQFIDQLHLFQSIKDSVKQSTRKYYSTFDPLILETDIFSLFQNTILNKTINNENFILSYIPISISKNIKKESHQFIFNEILRPKFFDFFKKTIPTHNKELCQKLCLIVDQSSFTELNPILKYEWCRAMADTINSVFSMNQDECLKELFLFISDLKFWKDHEVHRSFSESFRLNSSLVEFSLAKFIDGQIRAKDESQIETILDLVKEISNVKAFIGHYNRFLAFRLFSQTDLKIEKLFLSAFNSVVGDEETKQIKFMLEDSEESFAKTESYHSISSDRMAQKVQFFIIRKTQWPIFEICSLIIDEIQNVRKEIEEKFIAHPHKLIQWNIYLETCTFTVNGVEISGPALHFPILKCISENKDLSSLNIPKKILDSFIEEEEKKGIICSSKINNYTFIPPKEPVYFQGLQIKDSEANKKQTEKLSSIARNSVLDALFVRIVKKIQKGSVDEVFHKVEQEIQFPITRDLFNERLQTLVEKQILSLSENSILFDIF